MKGNEKLRRLLPLIVLIIVVLLAEAGKDAYQQWRLQPREAQLILNGEDVGQAASIRTEKFPMKDGYRLGDIFAVVPTQDILEYLGLQTQWLSEDALQVRSESQTVTFYYGSVDLTLTDGETIPCWADGDYACYRGRKVGRLESDTNILKLIVEELIPGAKLKCRIDTKEATVHIDLLQP